MPTNAETNPRPAPQEPQIVAVYGTLRRGQSNHDWLVNAQFMGLGHSVERYALYIGTWPYVTASQAISPIVVELYQLSYDQLLQLDELEEHPQLYQRQWVAIVLNPDKVMHAWMYFCEAYEGVLNLTGDFLNT